jgi:hypothetical protein
MALTDFQEQFDNAYQEFFMKTLVAKESVASTRFEAKLKYGESLERFAYDISGVQVRTVTRGSASTVDTVTDSTELLTVNIEKEAVFHISDGEVTQAGPLNPGEVIGAKVAYKVSEWLDGRVFEEVDNALYTFDAGDLTTLTSSGTAITLDATTVPQMVSRMPAKLRYRNNQEVTSNMCLVVDSYAASDVTQYLLGKNIDLAGSTFKNGYTGDVHNAALYVSENLKGEVNLVVDVSTADETIVINGVTFTAKATPAAAGEFDIAGSVDAQGVIMADMINNAAGYAAGAGAAANYFEISAADRGILNNAGVVATYTAATDTLTITARGRIIYSDTHSGTVTNRLHCYYGKKGAIDLVIQDLSPVDMRKTDDRRGTNVFSSLLAGVKTFADGAKKFLDVHILVA